MKKSIKVLLTLCIILGMFSMNVLAADKPFEYEDEEIISTVQSIVTEITAFNENELEYYTKNSLGITKTACEIYLDYVRNDTLGEFVEFKDSDVENTKDSAIITITAAYEKTDLEMVVTYKQVGTSIVPADLTIELIDNGSTSKLDSIKNAGLNTVMGLSTVVIMLLFISFLISLFKIIPVMQEKYELKKKNKNAAEAAVENAVAQIAEKEELVDDTELVAVITAAICAATNSSKDGFVVRSIRKRRF